MLLTYVWYEMRLWNDSYAFVFLRCFACVSFFVCIAVVVVLVRVYVYMYTYTHIYICVLWFDSVEAMEGRELHPSHRCCVSLSLSTFYDWLVALSGANMWRLQLLQIPYLLSCSWLTAPRVISNVRLCVGVYGFKVCLSRSFFILIVVGWQHVFFVIIISSSNQVWTY